MIAVELEPNKKESESSLFQDLTKIPDGINILTFLFLSKLFN